MGKLLVYMMAQLAHVKLVGGVEVEEDLWLLPPQFETPEGWGRVSESGQWRTWLNGAERLDFLLLATPKAAEGVYRLLGKDKAVVWDEMPVYLVADGG